MIFRYFDIAVGLTLVVVSLMSLLGLGSRLLEIPILFTALLYLVVRVLRLIWVNTSPSLLLGGKTIGLCVVWNVGGHHRLVGLVVVDYGSRTQFKVCGIAVTLDLALLRTRSWEAQMNCSNGLGRTLLNSRLKKDK